MSQDIYHGPVDREGAPGSASVIREAPGSPAPRAR